MFYQKSKLKIEYSGRKRLLAVTKPTKQMGLDIGDEVIQYLVRPEDETDMDMLLQGKYQSYFIAVLVTDTGIVYDVRRASSERDISAIDGDSLMTILGPFRDYKGCLEFRFRLEDEGLEDEKSLKQCFRVYVRGLR